MPRIKDTSLNVTHRIEVRGGIRFRHLDACPCCGCTQLGHALDGGVDFETRLGNFDIRECKQCGIQITDPMPLAEDVHLLYADRSSHDFDGTTSFVDKLRRFNNIRQLKRLPSYLRDGNPTSLDYGCGSGFFTQSMRIYLPGRVIGSDFHSQAPPLISGRDDIEYVADSEIDALRDQIDLIVCRNVLEHVVDPVGFLARLRSLLKAGGLILIEVPNRCSNWTHLLGRYNFNYYLPRHIYHYSECSLVQLLTGFKLLRRWLDHSPILGKSFGNMFGRKISGFAVTGLVFLPLQIVLDAPFGRSSQLVLIAERT